MLPDREAPPARVPSPPPAATIVEVPPARERRGPLQAAAQAAVERMAARRGWPQVQILVPAAGRGGSPKGAEG